MPSFTEEFLPVEDQVDLLLRRGMLGDRKEMRCRLEMVSYFRLSGYWYPFRLPTPSIELGQRQRLKEFRAGTSFEDVWTRYTFDRRFRVLVMDAIERIEVAVRCQLVNHHTERHGKFAYAIDRTSLPNLKRAERGELLKRLISEQASSKEVVVQEFFDAHQDVETFLPFWMAAEVMTFGTLLHFYRGSPREVRVPVAAPFATFETIVDSWLLSLNTVRNICAHHGRLWNRELGTPPTIPNKPEWRTPVKIGNNRVFGVLSICKWTLDRIASQSQWSSRLVMLLNEYPGIPLESMGFPANWLDSPIWSDKRHLVSARPDMRNAVARPVCVVK